MIKKTAFALCLTTFLTTSVWADVVVEDFKVFGNQRLEKETILSYLPFKKGDTISSSDVNNALKKLYKTGFFEDVKLSTNNQNIEINVIERPIINSVSFDGNDKVDENVLKGELQI